MRVAVLGCGPAGLLAVHAAEQREVECDIYSRKVPSHIHGAQYLHEAIPGLIDDPPTVISYVKLGSSTGYAQKLYGSPLAPTSWASFNDGEYPAWPMARTYQKLWNRYGDRVGDCSVTPDDLKAFMDTDVYDIVFCSLPRNALCSRQHSFGSVGVMFEPESKLLLPDLVMYSGREMEPWYRTSNLFGHSWTEYPAKTGVRYPEGWLAGIKPTVTDCDCLASDSRLHRVGRFGRWEKKVLVSDAYKQACEVLDDAL